MMMLLKLGYNEIYIVITNKNSFYSAPIDYGVGSYCLTFGHAGAGEEDARPIPAPTPASESASSSAVSSAAVRSLRWPR